MLNIKQKGSFKNIFSFFKHSLDDAKWEKLWEYGELGVEALRNATPVDSGLTRDSWMYEVVETKDNISIVWKNTNVVDGWYNVAVFLQYGHGTANGGYVKGVDYINPALKPIFEHIANDLWGQIRR